MHIGQRIKEELQRNGHSAKWLSEQLECERTNVYNIFKRKNMDVALLAQVAIILNHDFFKEISEETFSGK